MGAPPPPPPAPPGVFGRPWIYFRLGPQYWSPGSWYLWGLWHLWSVEGTEVAPFPWGQGSYPRKKCQLQRLQEKPVLPSLQRRLLTLKVCGSSPPRTVGWHFRDRQRDSLWPGEHQKVQWPAGMQEHRSQAQKSSGEGGSQGIGSVDHSRKPRVLTAGAVKRATAARARSVGGAASTQLGRGVSWPPTHPPSPPPGASGSSAIGWGHP